MELATDDDHDELQIITNSEKKLFIKLLDMDVVNPDLAKKIMSFWMFLKSKLELKDIYYDKLYLAENEEFGCACEEAERVLAFIEFDEQISSSADQTPAEYHYSCPITSSTLSGPHLSLPNILQDRANVHNEILNIHDRVCNVAFKSILDERGGLIKGKDLDKSIAKWDDGEKGMHGNGNGSDNGDDNESLDLIMSSSTDHHQQPFRSTLNPNALEWNPSTEGPSMEDRSLFMTFSRAHPPLSRGEIIDYFQRKYGDCIEDIFIYRQKDGKAEFGKILFKFSSIPALILNGKLFEKICIGAKTLILKKYHSRR